MGSCCVVSVYHVVRTHSKIANDAIEQTTNRTMEGYPAWVTTHVSDC